MVWLMNRARANPPAEGVWLADLEDPDVVSACLYFGVDFGILQHEFAGYGARPPAAFDVRLYQAARAHSEDLILRDAQDHTGQFDRVADAGFYYSAARGNVFSYAKHGLHAHAGFNIDWGPGDDTGMQPGRGHRMAIMSLDGNYTNVGVAAVGELNPATSVGPVVVTGNFCAASVFYPDHYNRFLVGTVWHDANGNQLYEPGEGAGGVTVLPDHGTFYAVTSGSGGYAIPVTSSGTYEITFSGPGVSAGSTRTVSVGDVSVLLDLVIEETSPAVDLIEAFVARFYEQCLGRTPDEGGLAYWTGALLDGSLTGGDVAWNFVFSQEFLDLDTTDGEFLDVLYRAFWDREPDAGGLSYWLGVLESGTGRDAVLDGFVRSEEFLSLCDRYGIVAY